MALDARKKQKKVEARNRKRKERLSSRSGSAVGGWGPPGELFLVRGEGLRNLDSEALDVLPELAAERSIKCYCEWNLPPFGPLRIVASQQLPSRHVVGVFEIDKSEGLRSTTSVSIDDAVYDQEFPALLNRLFLNPIRCEFTWARTLVFKAMNNSLGLGLIPVGDGFLGTCVFMNLNPNGNDSSLPSDQSQQKVA